jgi:two-component sensor histidine kinase
VISLVDDRRQWFKAEIGLDVRETALVESICAQAIHQPGLFVVPDASKDQRFDNNPLVQGAPHLRFYAGARLETPEGLPLGALCVLDTKPREGLTEAQRFSLSALARQVMAQMELRWTVVQRDEALAASQRAEQRQALLVRELHHRIRNTLALVQSLLGSTARSSKSIDGFYAAFSTRIASLARTQTLLTEDYWQTASLREMLSMSFSRSSRSGLGAWCSKVLPSIYRLIWRSGWYGAPRVDQQRRPARVPLVPEGRVQVTWDLTQVDGKRMLHLEWTERDGPPVQTPQQRGFGSTLLDRVLAMQANAKVQITFDTAGLTFRMDAPLMEHRLVPEY